MVFIQENWACSMYKVTADGKTMVGCNEDAWRSTSRIWFENALSENRYGACFTGSREVGQGKFAPQSGMNEAGLVFSRLVAYHPKKAIDQSDKKQMPNEVDYLSDILHRCKTVQEVKRYIDQFDHSNFLDDVFIYIDKSGDYLVVEPYQCIEGNDSSYVLANFCPSIVNEEEARGQQRYNNGVDYLKIHGLATSLEFCTALSDTMHVCRERNGDGTLLTSIWDAENGLVNLFFYHRYDTTVLFHLTDELKKGNYMLTIPDLFPENEEFQRFIDYKTPFNVPFLRYALVFAGGLLLTLSVFLIFGYFKKNESRDFRKIQLIIILMNLLAIGYLFILATNIEIFYFNAPYEAYSSLFISNSSYFPFLLGIGVLPIAFFTFKFFKSNTDKRWIKSVLFLNIFMYLMLISAFGYWGLFDCFG
jgi:hypothetical protein